MGPAVLITLGLLFLLANLSNYPFQRTWPILLIVMGAIKLLRYAVTDRAHVNPPDPYQPPYAGPNSPPGTYPPASQSTVPENMPQTAAQNHEEVSNG
jgi:hypothetical protein